MRDSTYPELDRRIAATRIVLSAVAILSVYIDPTRPALTRWLPLTGGLFAIDAVAFGVMTLHLVYALLLYGAVTRQQLPTDTLDRVATTFDIAFAAAIALVTEGATSPSYPFFAFAILAVGCRAGLRATLRATTMSVVIYTGVILSSVAPTTPESYVMRPAYLALAGILIAYLAQLRLRAEARLRMLEAAAERERVARSLHDGHAQTLAGVSLTLQSCCELMRRGRHDDVLGELSRLQIGVTREHGALRAYIRSLADLDVDDSAIARPADAQVTLHAAFDGSASLVENALCIMLEGLRNARRHARAKHVTLRAASDGTTVALTIDDDGVGFPAGTALPWSIISRAGDFGGHVRLTTDTTPGAHLRVEMPLA